MSENVQGYNTRLSRGAAVGTSLPSYLIEVFSDVLDIESLTLPAPTRPVESWKVLDKKSTKKLVGSIDYSPCSGSCSRLFGDLIQDSMQDDANAAASVRRNWRGIMPDTNAETHYWVGYCSKFEYQGISNDGRLQYAWEIVVDGDVIIVR